MAKLKHVSIATQDPEKTAEFYRTIFDLQVVGKVDNDNAEGFYLSDGDINIAILRYKNETVAGLEFGTEYSGLHHIGFQVDDMASVDAKLKNAEAQSRTEIDSARRSEMGEGHGGRNVALNYESPDGVMIDISQGGWVGTGTRNGKNGLRPRAS